MNNNIYLGIPGNKYESLDNIESILPLINDDTFKKGKLMLKEEII